MSRGATARLFVAVDPPPQLRSTLADWARDAAAGLAQPPPAGAGLRLLDPELLHLTVCFLGARPVAEIPALASVLETCAAHACELSIGAPMWLPEHRPRALVVAVHDLDGELLRLQEQLAGALARVSAWQPDRARFRPHITVARMRRTRRGSRGDGHGAPALAPTPRLQFMPESLSLYRSWLGPGGATYEAIAACTLLPAGS